MSALSSPNMLHTGRKCLVNPSPESILYEKYFSDVTRENRYQAYDTPFLDSDPNVFPLVFLFHLSASLFYCHGVLQPREGQAVGRGDQGGVRRLCY